MSTWRRRLRAGPPPGCGIMVLSLVMIAIGAGALAGALPSPRIALIATVGAALVLRGVVSLRRASRRIVRILARERRAGPSR